MTMDGGFCGILVQKVLNKKNRSKKWPGCAIGIKDRVQQQILSLFFFFKMESCPVPLWCTWTKYIPIYKKWAVLKTIYYISISVSFDSGKYKNIIIEYFCILLLMSKKLNKLDSGNENVDGQMHKQMDALTGTNFESNLAQVVAYHHVKF